MIYPRGKFKRALHAIKPPDLCKKEMAKLREKRKLTIAEIEAMRRVLPPCLQPIERCCDHRCHNREKCRVYDGISFIDVINRRFES